MVVAPASRRTKTAMTPAVPPIQCAMANATAPTTAAIGNVTSHAVAIRPATRHRTSAPLRPRPVPRIDPVATCVVES